MKNGNIGDFFKGADGSLNFLGKLLMIAIVWIVGKVIIEILHRFLFKSFQKRNATDPKRERRMKTVLNLVFNTVRVIIYFFIIVIFLDTLGVDTKSVIATAGIASVAIGFGAQSLVKDAISGIFILSENQYDLGEYVKIKADTEHVGTVKNFSVRSTKLLDAEGGLHTIPNGTITSVINYSREMINYFLVYPVSYLVKHSDATDAANEALLEYYDDVGKDFMTSAPIVQGVKSFEENCYNIQILFSCKVSDQWQLSRALNNCLLKKWEEKKFASPSVKTFLRGEYDA